MLKIMPTNVCEFLTQTQIHKEQKVATKVAPEVPFQELLDLEIYKLQRGEISHD